MPLPQLEQMKTFVGLNLISKKNLGAELQAVVKA